MLSSTNDGPEYNNESFLKFRKSRQRSWNLFLNRLIFITVIFYREIL